MATGMRLLFRLGGISDAAVVLFRGRKGGGCVCLMRCDEGVMAAERRMAKPKRLIQRTSSMLRF